MPRLYPDPCRPGACRTRARQENGSRVRQVGSRTGPEIGSQITSALVHLSESRGRCAQGRRPRPEAVVLFALDDGVDPLDDLAVSHVENARDVERLLLAVG